MAVQESSLKPSKKHFELVLVQIKRLISLKPQIKNKIPLTTQSSTITNYHVTQPFQAGQSETLISHRLTFSNITDTSIHQPNPHCPSLDHMGPAYAKLALPYKPRVAYANSL